MHVRITHYTMKCVIKPDTDPLRLVRLDISYPRVLGQRQNDVVVLRCPASGYACYVKVLETGVVERRFVRRTVIGKLRYLRRMSHVECDVKRGRESNRVTRNALNFHQLRSRSIHSVEIGA